VLKERTRCSKFASASVVSCRKCGLAGYEDVNDAVLLDFDSVMRQIVGGRAVEHHAASASQTGRFETEVLTAPDNLAALAEMSGCESAWVCGADRRAKSLKSRDRGGQSFDADSHLLKK
jgi:hypothetical protein